MTAPTLNAARNIETARVFTEVYIGDPAAIDDTSGLFGWGVTPVAKRTTYTETYSTAARTIPAATYAAPTIGANTLVLTGTNIAAKTASLTLIDAVNTNAGTVATSLDQAQKDLGTAINTANTSIASLNTQLVALAADVLALKKINVALVQDLKALGFVKAA